MSTESEVQTHQKIMDLGLGMKRTEDDNSNDDDAAINAEKVIKIYVRDDLFYAAIFFHSGDEFLIAQHIASYRIALELSQETHAGGKAKKESKRNLSQLRSETILHTHIDHDFAG